MLFLTTDFNFLARLIDNLLRCHRLQSNILAMPIQVICVGSPIMTNISIILPRAAQQQVTCSHWNHITFNNIFVWSNLKLYSHHVADLHLSTISQPLNVVCDRGGVPNLSVSGDNFILVEDDPHDPTTTSKPEVPMQSLNQLPMVTNLVDARSA
jgi:hypothetical protein